MTRDSRHHRLGFSLVEVLLAIFILGVGVIAVAALFPAGIAQQRRSVDDIIGPIVANNAMAVLRTRLRPDDFGTFEEHISYVSPTIDGDWTWRRPSVFFDTTMAFPDTIYAGSISIFGNSSSDVAPDAWEPDSGVASIPWNTDRYGSNDPLIIFNQGERYYPMQTQTQPLTPPQYVWDCMFRRYQGNILVAIFVYRVTVPGGGSSVYRVPQTDGTLPPLPIDLVIDPMGGGYDAALAPFMGEGMWDAGTANVPEAERRLIRATVDSNANPYDRQNVFQAWQEPRQWILDQNNNVHRTLSRFVNDSDAVFVELVRPVPEALPSYFANGDPAVPTNQFPNLAYNFLDTDDNGLYDTNVVTRIWYLPLEIDHPDGTYLLTPVYVTVREL
jgi:hypothetical protein